jgi:hypothetical protein
MPAFYSDAAEIFLRVDAEQVIGRLTAAAADAGFHQQLHSQTLAWREQTEVLRSAIGSSRLGRNGFSTHVLLEYPIPRRGKRIDAVFLAEGLIVVLEVKCGATRYDFQSVCQVEDYCLDLRDFHLRSRGRLLVPVLIATDATDVASPDGDARDSVSPVWRANQWNLHRKLDEISDRYASARDAIDPHCWERSDYTPTPTIIEAAQALYAGTNVRDISRCEAGVENLTRTTDAVLDAVAESRKSDRKLVCFVTGVPGAGKTLAGLNIVHNHGLHDGDLGVFLSGNGPLVRVLTEALARDHRGRTGMTLKESRREVNTFISNVHRFIDEYFADKDKVPVDRVVVFDEAQRAWDAEQSTAKFRRPFSEPELMLDIMGRHDGWAVVVALVGMGQEINRGEAGLREWGRALMARKNTWMVAISPELAASCGSHALFELLPQDLAVRTEPALHLGVSIRSFRTDAVSDFVDAVLGFEPERARELASKLDDFPLWMTRSLDEARRWLKRCQRGTRRTGLIASSGARRLRAHGLDVTLDLDVENWFLNPSDDVRSSYSLEVPATEFGIQGLELDWTGVCWGGDLSISTHGWVCRSFRGTSWRAVRDLRNHQFTINKYRVLMTRAREGSVIWIPPGDLEDPTRPPEIYDRIAAYLAACGVSESASA